jgi:hypothetical protein
MTTTRRTKLDALRSRPAETAWTRDPIALVGAAARISASDPGDEGEENEMTQMIEEADRLLSAITTSVARVHADLPDLSPVHRWLADPRGPWTEAVATIDALGTIAAGLATLAPESSESKRATTEVASLAKEIAHTAKDHSSYMLDAAVAASERIADEGVCPGPDDALIALADVVGTRLEAALRGEPLEMTAPIRARAIAPSLSQALSETLQKALRKPSLDVSPDLLELSIQHSHAPSLRGDVMLHQASPEPARDTRPVELLRGVKVVYRGSELEVSLESSKEAPLLVPILRGEPGKPCASRGGSHARETIFTLDADDGDEIDGYALVVGERVVFLRRV